MDRTQIVLSGVVIGLWVLLHLVDAAADLMGTPWVVPAEVDQIAGAVLAAVLGGPKLVEAATAALARRNGNGNGKGKPSPPSVPGVPNGGYGGADAN